MKKGTARSWKESLEVNICWTATVSSTSKKKTMAAAAAMPIEKAMGILSSMRPMRIAKIAYFTASPPPIPEASSRGSGK